jgi:hypothetical protein
MSSNPYEPPRTGSLRRPDPVKVKAYGLIPLTRTAYLSIQVVMAVAFVVVLLATRFLFAAPGHPLHFLYAHTLLVIVVLLALEGVETVVMLAKFRSAERRRMSQ